MDPRPKTPHIKVDVVDEFLRFMILETSASKFQSFLDGMFYLGGHFQSFSQTTWKKIQRETVDCVAGSRYSGRQVQRSVSPDVVDDEPL